MNQQRPSNGSFPQFRNGPGMLSGGGPSGIHGVTMTGQYGSTGQIPPPIPSRIPRPMPQSYQQPFMGSAYSNYTNGYGYGNNLSYRGIGNAYGSYGGFRHPYLDSGYTSQFGGPSGDVENRFVQFAEESSRPAFQSIESIVQTFTSISMMLESTFFAMTSSFRAIIGVAENVGRVKTMFGELLNAFALIRLVKWLYRKIAYALGLNPDDPSTEHEWRKTAVQVMNGEKRSPSTWPILVFFSLIIAIPYMINKLVKSVSQETVTGNDPKDWVRYNEPIYSALALFDFNAATPEELTVKAGQKIWLAPQTLQPKNLVGWSRATDNASVGLVPSNYLKIVGELRKRTENTNLEGAMKEQPTNVESQNSPKSEIFVEQFEASDRSPQPESNETTVS